MTIYDNFNSTDEVVNVIAEQRLNILLYLLFIAYILQKNFYFMIQQ